MADIFDVQDEIARAVTSKLKVSLTGGAARRLVRQTTTNVEAWELYEGTGPMRDETENPVRQERVVFTRIVPSAKRLRADPRFADVLRRLALPT